MSSTERVHRKGRSIDAGTSAAAVVALLHAEDLNAVRAVGKVQGAIARGAERIAQALGSGGRLVYAGAGTSGRLGALDAAECPPTFGTEPQQVVALIAGGPGALTRAVEGAEDDARAGRRVVRRLGVGANDVVCGISASGKARWVRAVLAQARAQGAATILICCDPRMARKIPVDLRICPATGAEVLAGSTRLKAGTATKLVLNALSTAAMARLGKIEAGRMAALRPTNRKLQKRAVGIIAELLGVSDAEAASRLRKSGDVGRALGRG
jgi:N-acetylmuramic acid 6-phosphate etherase